MEEILGGTEIKEFWSREIQFSMKEEKDSQDEQQGTEVFDLQWEMLISGVKSSMYLDLMETISNFLRIWQLLKNREKGNGSVLGRL